MWSSTNKSYINKNWKNYNKSMDIFDCTEQLLYHINNPSIIGENKNNHFSNIIDNLKLSTKMISTFGAGVSAFYPFVQSLIHNGDIRLEQQDIMLLTVAGISVLINDPESQALVREIEVKNLSNIFEKVKNSIAQYTKVMNLLRKKTGTVASSLMDMLGYTSLLVPSIDTITTLINNNHINLDNAKNMLAGIAASAGAYGIKSLIDSSKD